MFIICIYHSQRTVRNRNKAVTISRGRSVVEVRVALGFPDFGSVVYSQWDPLAPPLNT